MRTKQIVVVSMAAVLMVMAVGCSSSKSKDNPAAASTTTTKADGTGADSGDDGGSGDAVALPAGWPSELAMPAGTTVTEATKIGDGGSLMVVTRNDGDGQAIYDAFKTELSGAGYEIVGSTFTPTDKGGYGSISAKGPTYTVAIAFGPNDTGTISQTTINIAPVEPS